MSAEAVGWVYRHSPYTGAVFAVHHAVADTVNDQNGNRFWMKQSRTAIKARTSRKSVNEALATLEADGFLRRAGKGPADTIAFVFLFPDVPVVYESRDLSPAVTSGVTTGDTTCHDGSHDVLPDVTTGTQDNSTDSKRERRKRRTPPPDDFAPNDSHRAIASELALDLGAELIAWLDKCRANAYAYLDHDAAFRNWLRNAPKYGPARPVLVVAPFDDPSCPLGLCDGRDWVYDEDGAHPCPHREQVTA